MTIVELKKYIYEENKIEYILADLNCHHIKYHQNKDYYTCANPDGDNPNAVVIKNNEYLNTHNYTRKIDDDADLITLIQFYKKQTLYQALKYLHTLLDLKMTYDKKTKEVEKVDPLAIFKKVKQRRNRCNVADLEILDESILNDFVPYVHIDWYREGVMPWSVEKFGLGYSFERQRVIIPHRYWQDGSLVGIMGRTMIENYKELGIQKYLPIKEYLKSNNLYGLWENYDSIQKAGYVVVMESEKSTIKRHSLGDGTCVALGCHSISSEQARVLIGLNTNEIIIALDKGLDINESRHLCEKFYGIRNVSYIYDKWDLLKDKEAPMDVKNKIYEFLLKYRVRYDEKEHKEYLKSLNRSDN